MPNSLSQLPEWNEENLSKVVTDLYKEAETNQTLHGQLMDDPVSVLSTRINVPEDYRGGIFVREKNKQTMVMYVPPYAGARDALPEGTTEAEPPPNYEIICTTSTVW